MCKHLAESKSTEFISVIPKHLMQCSENSANSNHFLNMVYLHPYALQTHFIESQKLHCKVNSIIQAQDDKTEVQIDQSS
jgi:hypothetical protein